MNSFSKVKIQEQVLQLQKARIEFQQACEPILLAGMVVNQESVRAFFNLTAVIKKCEMEYSITSDIEIDRNS